MTNSLAKKEHVRGLGSGNETTYNIPGKQSCDHTLYSVMHTKCALNNIILHTFAQHRELFRVAERQGKARHNGEY